MIRRRIHVQQAPDVTIVETPPPVVVAGDLDILWVDSFAVADAMAGTLGPIQTQDSIVVTDDPDMGPATLEETFGTDDDAFIDAGTVTPTDSFISVDVILDQLTLANFGDTFDATDTPAGTVTLPDTFGTDDDATLTGGTVSPADTVRFADARGDTAGQMTLPDTFDLEAELAALVSSVAETFGAADTVVGSTLGGTEYAAATTATTGMTNPANVVGNNTSSFAECSAAASGVGGTTSNDTTFTMAVSMSDLDVDDYLTSWTNVDVFFEWSFVTDGTAVAADGGHDMDWQYSLNDGGSWTTLAANDHLNHGTAGVGNDAKQTTTFDLTGVLDSQGEFNQLRVRANGLVRSGTGLSRVSRLRFHRMWATFTVAQT